MPKKQNIEEKSDDRGERRRRERERERKISFNLNYTGRRWQHLLIHTNFFLVSPLSSKNKKRKKECQHTCSRDRLK